MYSVTRLLDVVEPERDRLLGQLRAAATEANALHWVVQPTLPGTRNGGDILVSPPICLDDQVNTVTITWRLPDVRAWWEMTWKARPDPALAEWWSQIGELVQERSRSFAAAADDVDGLCDV